MEPTSSSETNSLDPRDREILLRIARASIESGLDRGRELSIHSEEYRSELQEPRATFVTLRIEGALRGCIGSCQPVRPLVEDIAHSAYAAAFLDPRFPPLSKEELEKVQIHISLLSVPEEISFDSEEEMCAQVRPGVDGLLLEEGMRKGTLLPAVWESLPEVNEFVRHLKLKAGLPADYWSDRVKIYRYTAESIE